MRSASVPIDAIADSGFGRFRCGDRLPSLNLGDYDVPSSLWLVPRDNGIGIGRGLLVVGRFKRRTLRCISHLWRRRVRDLAGE